MEFRAKVDRFFVLLNVLIVLTVAAALYWPLWLGVEAGDFDVYYITAIFLASVGFMVWCGFSVKYVFREDHLYVRGGPFRSRIPYRHIRKVEPTKNIFVGYRLLSSFDAMEIFYDGGLLGSVKISPQDKKKFLAELEKRCPHARIHKDLRNNDPF